MPGMRVAHFIHNMTSKVGDKVQGQFPFSQAVQSLISWEACLAEQENGPFFSQVSLVYILSLQIPRESLQDSFEPDTSLEVFVISP